VVSKVKGGLSSTLAASMPFSRLSNRFEAGAKSRFLDRTKAKIQVIKFNRKRNNIVFPAHASGRRAEAVER